MESPDAILTALDARHAAASAAFANKDIAAYRSLFSDRLQYRRQDGLVLDLDQLMKSVKSQFRRLDRAESRFVREALAQEGDEITETLHQTARAEASAFGIIRRLWAIERRGHYSWAKEDGQWKIVRVDILTERIGSRWRLGF